MARRSKWLKKISEIKSKYQWDEVKLSKRKNDNPYNKARLKNWRGFDIDRCRRAFISWS